MRKYLFLSLMFCAALCLNAQQQLLNANFQDWTNGGNPDYWATPYSLNPGISQLQGLVSQDYTTYNTGNSSLRLEVDEFSVNGHWGTYSGSVTASTALAGTNTGVRFIDYPMAIVFDYRYYSTNAADFPTVNWGLYYQGNFLSGTTYIYNYHIPGPYTITNSSTWWVTDTVYVNTGNYEPVDSMQVSFAASGADSASMQAGTTLWIQNVRFLYGDCGFTSMQCVPAPVSCTGQGDGTITIDYTYSGLSFPANDLISYNGAPFSSWAGGGYSHYSITNLVPGTYILWMYDQTASFCAQFDTVVITEPSPLGISVTATPTDGINNNGTATANVSGGTPPYTYYWSNGQSTATISGLAVGTYHVTVYDHSGCGVSDIAIISFPTPAVTTNAATNVQLTNAQLNGVVDPNNTPDTVSFEWGNTTAYGHSNPASPNIVTGTSSTAVSASLFGLTPNTTYHYRTVAVTYHTRYYGADQQFYTSPSTTPSITTNPATSVTTTGAQLNGVIQPNSTNATGIMFEWGNTNSYGSTISATPGTASGSGSTNVSAALTSLQPNTTYYFQAMATDGGTIYGGQQQFTTGGSSSSASILSNPASNVTSTGAQLNATVNPNSTSVTNISFDWGTTTGYGNSNAANPNTASGSASINVSAAIGALQPNTTYYYQAKAASQGVVFTGGQQQFYTSATGIPVVSIEDAAIYPNPAKQQFTLETHSNETYTLAMFNLMGEKVGGQVISQPVTTIDVSSLAGGVYIVSLIKDEAVRSFRVVVMNNQ